MLLLVFIQLFISIYVRSRNRYCFISLNGKCKVCKSSFYYEKNPSFEDSDCKEKSNSMKSIISFVSSNSSIKTIEGHFNSKYSNLSNALHELDKTSKTYAFSQITIYLDREVHFLQPIDFKNEYNWFFRWSNTSIVIEQLPCNLLVSQIDCNDQEKKAIIDIKARNIHFFYSYKMVVKNIKFIGYDLQYEFDDDYLIIPSSCLNQKVIHSCIEFNPKKYSNFYNSSNSNMNRNDYGIFNPEIYLDAQTQIPEIKLENIEFESFFLHPIPSIKYSSFIRLTQFLSLTILENIQIKNCEFKTYIFLSDDKDGSKACHFDKKLYSHCYDIEKSKSEENKILIRNINIHYSSNNKRKIEQSNSILKIYHFNGEISLQNFHLEMKSYPFIFYVIDVLKGKKISFDNFTVTNSTSNIILKISNSVVEMKNIIMKNMVQSNNIFNFAICNVSINGIDIQHISIDRLYYAEQSNMSINNLEAFNVSTKEFIRIYNSQNNFINFTINSSYFTNFFSYEEHSMINYSNFTFNDIINSNLFSFFLSKSNITLTSIHFTYSKSILIFFIRDNQNVILLNQINLQSCNNSTLFSPDSQYKRITLLNSKFQNSININMINIISRESSKFLALIGNNFTNLTYNNFKYKIIFIDNTELEMKHSLFQTISYNFDIGNDNNFQYSFHIKESSKVSFINSKIIDVGINKILLGAQTLQNERFSLIMIENLGVLNLNSFNIRSKINFAINYLEVVNLKGNGIISHCEFSLDSIESSSIKSMFGKIIISFSGFDLLISNSKFISLGYMRNVDLSNISKNKRSILNIKYILQTNSQNSNLLLENCEFNKIKGKIISHINIFGFPKVLLKQNKFIHSSLSYSSGSLIFLELSDFVFIYNNTIKQNQFQESSTFSILIIRNVDNLNISNVNLSSYYPLESFVEFYDIINFQLDNIDIHIINENIISDKFFIGSSVNILIQNLSFSNTKAIQVNHILHIFDSNDISIKNMTLSKISFKKQLLYFISCIRINIDKMSLTSINNPSFYLNTFGILTIQNSNISKSESKDFKLFELYGQVSSKSNFQNVNFTNINLIDQVYFENYLVSELNFLNTYLNKINGTVFLYHNSIKMLNITFKNFQGDDLKLKDHFILGSNLNIDFLHSDFDKLNSDYFAKIKDSSVNMYNSTFKAKYIKIFFYSYIFKFIFCEDIHFTINNSTFINFMIIIKSKRSILFLNDSQINKELKKKSVIDLHHLNIFQSSIKILNIRDDNYPYLLKGINSDVTILNSISVNSLGYSIFIKSKIELTGSESSTLSIRNCTFIFINCNVLEISNYYHVILSKININFAPNTFSNAGVLENIYKLEIQDFNMSNFFQKSQAVKTLDFHKVMNLRLNKISFINNTSFFGSSFIIFDSTTISIKHIVFYNNTAIINDKSTHISSGLASGGVAICENQLECGKIYIESLKAWNNTAQLYFPVFLTNYELILKDFKLSNNTSKGSSEYLDIFSTHENNLDIKFENYDLRIIPGRVYDLKFFMISRIETKLIKLSFSNSLILSQDINNSTISSVMNLGKGIFSDLTVYRNSFQKEAIIFTTTSVLDFSQYFSFSNFRMLNISITIFLRNFTFNLSDCEDGDIWKEDKKVCSKCLKPFFSTKFSYNKGQKCLPCNNELEYCEGGSDIRLKNGYWRKSKFSNLILECYNENACQQERNYSWAFSDRYCSEKQNGNLCFDCDDGYGKAKPSSLCTKCEDQYQFFLIKSSIVVVTISIYFFLITWHSTIKKDKFEENSDYLNPLLNIFLSFNQIYQLIDVQILNFYNINIDISLRTYFAEYVSIINNGIYISDCFMKDIIGERKYIFYLGSSLSLYIFIILILAVITILWIIAKLLSKITVIKSKNIISSFITIKCFLVVSSLIIFNFFYTALISQTLNLLDCTKISSEENELYLSINPLIRCWNDDHIRILSLLGLPNIIIFGFIIPIILLYLLSRLSKIKDIKLSMQFKKVGIDNQSNLNQKRKTRISIIADNIMFRFKKIEHFLLEKNILQFYYEGLKVDFYYWEMIRIILKLICTIMMNLKSYIDQKSIGIVLFIIFSIYLIVLLHNQPYDNLHCNRLDILSTIGLLVISMNKYGYDNVRFPQILQYLGVILILLVFLYSFINIMKLLLLKLGLTFKFLKKKNEKYKTILKITKSKNINLEIKRKFF